MKKYIIATVASVIVLTLAAIFYVRVFSHRHVKTDTEIIQDSILYHSKQAKIHKDSAEFHQKQYEESWGKYIDTATLNAAGWDSIRTKYRTDLEEKIRASYTGFSDSLRAVEAGGKQPAKSQ